MAEPTQRHGRDACPACHPASRPRHLVRQLGLNAQLRELSHVDALTGLANRRRLEADYARLAQSTAPDAGCR